MRFQGRYHEWLPVYNDPENPCALKCRAKDSGLVLELAPKVLDGTRCYTESLDMCISGACQVGEAPTSSRQNLAQFSLWRTERDPRLSGATVSVWFQIVGCDHELGSAAKEDNCGVCGGYGATCRLVRGHYRSQHDSGRSKKPGSGSRTGAPVPVGSPCSLFAPLRRGHGGRRPLLEPPRAPGAERSGSLV